MYANRCAGRDIKIHLLLPEPFAEPWVDYGVIHEADEDGGVQCGELGFASGVGLPWVVVERW